MLKYGIVTILLCGVAASTPKKTFKLRHDVHNTNVEPIVHSLLDMESQLNDIHRRQHKIQEVAHLMQQVRIDLEFVVLTTNMNKPCYRECTRTRVNAHTFAQGDCTADDVTVDAKVAAAAAATNSADCIAVPGTYLRGAWETNEHDHLTIPHGVNSRKTVTYKVNNGFARYASLEEYNGDEDDSDGLKLLMCRYDGYEAEPARRRLADLLTHTSDQTIVKTQAEQKMFDLMKSQCKVSDMERRAELLAETIPQLKQLYSFLKGIVNVEGMVPKPQHTHEDVNYDGYGDDHHHHDHNDHDDHHDDHHDDGWKKRYDSQHRQYWENSRTGQTQWENPYHHRLHSTNTHIQKLCDLHTIHIKSLRATHVATEICTDHESATTSDKNCIDLIVSEMSKISLIQSSIDDFEKRLVKLRDAEKAVEYAITKLLKATDITEMNN
jgi:hypothetical protein